MADFDDVTLERPPGDEPPPPARSRVWLILPVVLALAAAAVWYWWPARQAPDAAPQAAPAAPPPAEVRNPEPGENIPLPPLGESDALVRELVSALSSHPRVAAWLTTDNLIRNFTVSVVNIAQGPTPSRHLKAVAPAGAFQVTTEGGRTVIDPRSYTRYDGHADAVGALDARGAARLYATLKPRIEEAHKELGVPGTIDATLERAILTLLRTPIVDGPVAVEPSGAMYRFADPALESLTPAQRQFLRMGPRNMRIVAAKLREIARYLDIPEANLPPEARREG